MTPKIPVTVLAGAMGAGKTTLINHIVAESGLRILVIQNEIGEVTAEGAPIVATDEEIFEMDDGLVCGTVRLDLIRALVSVTRRRQQYDRILIEATGPADPGPIVRTFLMDQEIQRSFRLDGLAMLVDGRLLSLYTQGKTGSHEQIAFANVLIVNKTDMVSAGEVAEMERWLRGVNTTARVRSTSYGNLPLDQLLNIGRHAIDRALGRGTRPSDVRDCPRSSAPARRVSRPSWAPPCRRRRPRAGASMWANTRARSRGAPVASWPSRPRRATSKCGARADGHPMMRRDGPRGRDQSIAWQPGQARVATAGEDGAVRILQLGADEPLVVVRPSRRTIDVIGWNPKGDRCGRQGRRGPALRRRRQADPPHPGRRQHDHRSHLVARRRRHRVSCYGGVHVIDPNTGARLRHLTGKGSMLSLAWSPDGASSRPAARTTTCTSGASRRATTPCCRGRR